MRCSNRCAKPVRPGRSFLEPTWYHWFTWTTGSLRSTWRTTWSPFGSVYFSNSSFGTEEPGAEAGGEGGGIVPFFAVSGGGLAPRRLEVASRIAETRRAWRLREFNSTSVGTRSGCNGRRYG